MSKSAPKIGLAIGIGLIAVCVIAGVMVSGGSNNAKLLEDTQATFNDFSRLNTWTSTDAEKFAREVVLVNDLHPAALSYEDGRVNMLIPMQPSMIDKIFSPGSRSYRSLFVQDFDKSFEKRWRSTLSGRFGAPIKASGRTPVYFNPRFGKVTITRKVHKAGSSNPLDYLDFTFAP